MKDSLAVLHSRQLCEQICRSSKSSFWISFMLLERPRRQAMCALYAFARLTDDLGDSPHPAAVRAANLAAWRGQLWQHCQPESSPAAVDAGPQPQVDIWPAVHDAMLGYQIPIQWLDEIIEGVSMDLYPRQPANWSEVDRYCYHVASTVGLACGHIWRSDSRATLLAPTDGHTASPVRQAAIDCGIAFQLTNILRDIAEDARQGRIYLPQSLFDEFGMNATDWLAGRPHGAWETMLDAVVHRAREHYQSGWRIFESLTPDSQRMFSLMWRSYRGLLERVALHKSRLWGHNRLRLPASRRLRLLTTHLVSPIFARLAPP